MDLDLTLRLGLTSQAPNTTQSILDFQRSISARQQNLPPPKEMDQFCLFDFSVSKSKVGGSKKRKTSDSEQLAPPKTEDQNRMCTNYYCRVRETPMWRRGPMGPKTLCNACGIKYRKLRLKEHQGEGSSGEGSSSYQASGGFYY